MHLGRAKDAIRPAGGTQVSYSGALHGLAASMEDGAMNAIQGGGRESTPLDGYVIGSITAAASSSGLNSTNAHVTIGAVAVPMSHVHGAPLTSFEVNSNGMKMHSSYGMLSGQLATMG